jgi:hypothetical protein
LSNRDPPALRSTRRFTTTGAFAGVDAGADGCEAYAFNGAVDSVGSSQSSAESRSRETWRESWRWID